MACIALIIIKKRRFSRMRGKKQAAPSTRAWLKPQPGTGHIWPGVAQGPLKAGAEEGCSGDQGVPPSWEDCRSTRATTTDAPPPTRASSLSTQGLCPTQGVHTGALPHPLTSRLSFLPDVLVCKGFPSPFTKAEQIGKNRRFSIFLFYSLSLCYFPN